MSTLRVIIPAVNNPLFLHLQVEGLRVYMPKETAYEVIVFNDAKPFPDATNYGDSRMPQYIMEACSKLGIRCIPIENRHHQHIGSASHRHADTLRHIMCMFVSEKWGQILMLDSDMFPVCPLGPLLETYKGAEVGAFVLQRRGTLRYLWPNLFFLNAGSVEACRTDLLSWDVSPGCDSGGASQTWLSIQEALGPNRIQWIHHLPSGQWGPTEMNTIASLCGPLRNFLENDVRNKEHRFWAELYDNTFLHYRAGSNWNGEGAGVHIEMSELLASSYRRHLCHHNKSGYSSDS